MTPHAPLAEITRGPIVESIHHGVAAVADASGALIAAVGDPSLVTYPRSSLKAFQALPLVESGAADAFRLEPRHIALAVASHWAEPFHIALVTEWLARIGLDESALACGPAWPHRGADRTAMVRAGAGPARRLHECSGKHTGMLTACRHLSLPVEGYNDPAHPLQHRIRETLGALAGHVPAADACGTDGCNLPAIPLPVADMARALARFAAHDGGTPARSEAMARILEAMAAHPDHVSGSGSPTERLVQATAGRILVKSGAEGFLVAWLPAERLGIALKAADGNERATWPALVALLDALRLLSRAETEALAPLSHPPIRNSAGLTVGGIRPALRLQPIGA